MGIITGLLQLVFWLALPLVITLGVLAAGLVLASYLPKWIEKWHRAWLREQLYSYHHTWNGDERVYWQSIEWRLHEELERRFPINSQPNTTPHH